MKRKVGSPVQRARIVGVGSTVGDAVRKVIQQETERLAEAAKAQRPPVVDPRWFTSGGITVDISGVLPGQGFTVAPAMTPLQQASMRWGCDAKVVHGGA